MKKILALALVLVAGTASAAGVASTKHNMNTYTGNSTANNNTTPGTVGGGTGDVCYYCHTAHNTLTTTQAPLWARNLPTTTGYTLYKSPTISVNIATVDSVSLACLSCHDGTIAVNQTINGTVGGLAQAKYLIGNATTRIGPNISNDHPVSLQWAPDAANGLVASMPAPFQAYSTPIGSMTLTCAGCHEAHGTPGFSKFLRADPNSGSFCVTCHAAK
jgi:predicted CXXCH cytochrome family protein